MSVVRSGQPEGEEVEQMGVGAEVRKGLFVPMATVHVFVSGFWTTFQNTYTNNIDILG